MRGACAGVSYERGRTGRSSGGSSKETMIGKLGHVWNEAAVAG